MKDRHWNNLVSTLRLGRCILVLGPEVPADAPSPGGVPTSAPVTCTDALKEKLSRELRDDNISVTAVSLAGVAQHYEDADGFGPETLRSETAAFYATTVLHPSKVHRALAALPCPLFLSTCHDRLLEAALVAAEKKPIQYRYHLRGDRSDNPEFIAGGSAAAPIVYHLFGVCDEPSSLVMSENDILDFFTSVVSERPPLPNTLKRALQQPGVSLLFVGFGLRYWYQRVLLKVLIRSLLFTRSANAVAVEPFLTSVPDHDRRQTILFYQRGVRVEVSDDDVTEFLAELSRRLEAAGGATQHQAPVGIRARVFISYASEDRPLASRLVASLQAEGFEPWVDTHGLRGGDKWDDVIEDHLRDADYVLVLETPALAVKRVGYVNKEIAIARDQAQRYRGPFLIPLSTDADLVEGLSSYQRMPLRDDTYDEDFAAVASALRKESQRRQRQLS